MQPMQQAQQQERIAALENRILEMIGLALDTMERQLAPPPAPVMPQATDDEDSLASRRFMADQLALYVMCDRAACQRARRCCGRHVLCYLLHMDMVPPEVVTGLKVWIEAVLERTDLDSLRGKKAEALATLCDWRRRFGLSELPVFEKRHVQSLK